LTLGFGFPSQSSNSARTILTDLSASIPIFTLLRRISTSVMTHGPSMKTFWSIVLDRTNMIQPTFLGLFYRTPHVARVTPDLLRDLFSRQPLST
jgi:hypothetical protein